MDDALLVRRFECLGDLLRDRQRVIKRDRPAGNSLGKIFPLHQLHHERPDAAALFEPVDVSDVGMVQRRQHLRFARKSGQAVRGGRE